MKWQSGLKMNKIIKMSEIVKITNLWMDIFYEEDSDYPDYRVIKPKEKAIDRILDTITADKEEQSKVYEIITDKNFFAKTYKPICDDLRKLGYAIVEGA